MMIPYFATLATIVLPFVVMDTLPAVAGLSTPPLLDDEQCASRHESAWEHDDCDDSGGDAADSAAVARTLLSANAVTITVGSGKDATMSLKICGGYDGSSSSSGDDGEESPSSSSSVVSGKVFTSTSPSDWAGPPADRRHSGYSTTARCAWINQEGTVAYLGLEREELNAADYDHDDGDGEAVVVSADDEGGQRGPPKGFFARLLARKGRNNRKKNKRKVPPTASPSSEKSAKKKKKSTKKKKSESSPSSAPSESCGGYYGRQRRLQEGLPDLMVMRVEKMMARGDDGDGGGGDENENIRQQQQIGIIYAAEFDATNSCDGFPDFVKNLSFPDDFHSLSSVVEGEIVFH